MNKNILFLIILSCFTGLFAMEERQPSHGQGVDLYLLLRVNNDATTQDIDTAYKALEHREIMSGFKTVDYFFNVVRAYKILSNDKLRNIYDNRGPSAADVALYATGYPHATDLAVRTRIAKDQDDLRSKDDNALLKLIKEVNAYYRGHLFMGTAKLCDTLRDCIAQNYYNLAHGLFCNVGYNHDVVLEYIKQGLNFALPESPASNALKAFRNKLQKPIESKTKSPRVDLQQWRPSTNIQREAALHLLDDTNAKILNIVEGREAYETPTMFCKKIYEYLDAFANYTMPASLEKDRNFSRKRHLCSGLTHSAAEKLLEMSKDTIWHIYGLQHAKILCQKASDHTLHLQNIKRYRDTKQTIESSIITIQGSLDAWYTQGSCLVNFFTSPKYR